MKAAFARSARAVMVAVVCAAGAVISIDAQGGPVPKPVQPKPAQPWPDAAVLEARKKDAEGRRLFADDSVLEFTLTADFKAVNKDRNQNSTKVFPAKLTVAGADGKAETLDVNIRTRGHVRRLPQTCTFAPLRIEFPTNGKGTLFEGHKNIKLGTHCRDVDLFEQYQPREYVAYRMFNLLTPRSFRARLAKATYVDTATQKPLTTRLAMFIEDDDDVAKRMEGRAVEIEKVPFARLDPETLTLMTLFEYMIGNTDWSIYALHNVVLVQTPLNRIYPVPYDFDYSGLVNARYAIPAKELGLTSVRDRLYRGPCHQPNEFGPFMERFGQVKGDIMKLFDTIPGLDAGYRKDSQRYLEHFYEVVGRPPDLKKAFIDPCVKQAA